MRLSAVLAAAAIAVTVVIPGPVAAQGTRQEPSTIDQVKTWSNKQWQAAQREWRKDKARWASCRQQAKAKKLSGRANWSFHYECMTK